MKRIIFLTIFSFVSTVIYSQLSGSGTFSDPWSGTLAGDMTWNGTKYINGDITVDDETLTISPGATIIFLAEDADLIITGTGKLIASGIAGSMITFTADDDNDGNYGETGERWGHIWFNSPSESNASVIEYCIIEYGDVHNFTDYRGYGGAIHANFSNLTVSHCILRNNYAYWGGAIFVNQDKSPAISNCYIYNNKSSRGGGGIYCWNRAGSVITNCIFDSNQCLETSVSYYTGGGLAAQSNTSVKVINCTFVNNTSTPTEGQALLFHSSDNGRVINSIFWGAPEKQIYFLETSATNLINSAYRGVTAPPLGSPVNSIILSSSNDDESGPNFRATDGSDWSIKFISPCRDAGTNSYTGVTIPSTDYLGNYTIYNKDIGAFEVQYSRWKTTPSDIYTWTEPGNWEQGLYPGHANATGDVLIPALASSSVAPDVSSVSVPSGKYMVLEPGAKATIGSITNSGTLILRSDATNVSSLIVDNYSGNAATFELFLSGGGSPNYKWHYISSPVTSLSTDPFTDVTYNLAQYIEDRPSSNLLEGWVAYDGYIYSTGSTGGPTFSSLTPGKGYNFYDNTNNVITFSGTPNTGNIVVNLSYGGNPSLHGFNLLGNPYPSGLNWDDIVDGIYYDYPSNTSKGLYFTRDNQQCSYINRVGIPEDVTGIIPPMQGFFIKTYSTDNYITIPEDSRVHDNIHQRYKGSQIIPLVRLAIKENDQWKDETVIRFDEKAKQEFDYDFDAVKMFISPDNIYIYTTSGETKYAINGQPLPQGGNSSFLIPVTVNVISDNVEYALTSPQILGLPSDVKVFFKDNETGFTFDLTEGSLNYKFSAPAGLINNRFFIAAIATGSELINETRDGFIIYPAQEFINIIPVSELWEGRKGTIRIFDITGKELISRNNIIFSKNSEIKVNAPDKPGVYIINIRTGVLTYTGRFIIK